MTLFKNLFGYNSEEIEEVIFDGELYRTDLDFSPQYIVGQAFGANYDESSYNQILAQNILIARKCFDRDLQAIVQSEIGICLERMGETNHHTIGEIYKDGETSKVISKIDTKGVLAKSKKILDDLELPYDSALFIAHPYHVQRVMDRARDIGIIGRPFLKKEVTWPKQDSQPWVRSAFRFVPREIVARTLKK